MKPQEAVRTLPAWSGRPAPFTCTTMRNMHSFAQGGLASAGDYSPGDVLGQKYTVVEVIGRGSNGVTYRVSVAFGAWSADCV